MADKTVVNTGSNSDNDAAGWIILAIVLAFVAFVLFGGLGIFHGNSSNIKPDLNVSINK